MVFTIIYEELHSHRHLLSDPNLVIRLLHINVNYNYFEFSTFIFQQIIGTAMGVPTIANIFMSVILRRFLCTQRYHPLILKCCINDIIIIWTESQQLDTFLAALNDFHPSLHYMYTFSTKSTDFYHLQRPPPYSSPRHKDTSKSMSVLLS